MQTRVPRTSDININSDINNYNDIYSDINNYNDIYSDISQARYEFFRRLGLR